MPPSHDVLLKQAVDLAKANKRAEARELILKVLQQDESNARAWTLLARITTDIDERRVALMNVVNLEPFNAQAQEALAKLEGQLAISRSLGEDPTTPKRGGGCMRRLIVALILLMAVTIVTIFVYIQINNNENSSAFATDTAVWVQRTQTVQAVALLDAATATAEVQAIIDVTATYEAVPTQTFTPRPTLPPENTATPTITPTLTQTSVPRPEGLPGQIIGWGGRAASNDGYFPVIFISVNDGTIQQVSGSNRGDQVSAVSTSRIVYRRFFPDIFANELSVVDPITTFSTLLGDEWAGTGTVFTETAWPQFTPDGRLLVFSAVDAQKNRGIFVFDSQRAGDKILRITPADGFNYDMPTISPGGTTVVAVRSDGISTSQGVDLVKFDLLTGAREDWTTDGDATIEKMPRWSPDGKLLAYVTEDPETGNGDIVLRTIEGMITIIPVTRTPDIDEINPVFSPDTRYMAYASNFIEGYNIFIYDLLTNGFSQLTFDDEMYFPGAWVE
ncbi:MAG: PD40 domain-containing protein [Anaerolineae bacterium]|nr:hypothetical protein [Chloroflexota bacterium]MBV6437314.1 Protein TolB [Anaerolineae bacterium]MDL1915329.1 hypothetical protein [Anaerolineae bacterium CFX4]OQY86552.1 MAG: hypothetical protein B6D42_01000 [Anaerolineae bacterium UTCFX5]MCO6442892.1 PD40 domain-containing protein [Anaerolineae bacterium]